MKGTYAGLAVLIAAQLLLSAGETEWEYGWNVGNARPKVSPAPFLYGKTWAYSIELDDGGIMAKTVAQPLFSEFKFTDAPPGVRGGKPLPFVGTAAIMACNISGGNSTILGWDDMKELISSGWDLSNHSYWHSGNHWDKSKMLSTDQFRRELFWSQAVISHHAYGGLKAPSSFVYPSGDYNYKPHLRDFNLIAASRVGGSSPPDIFHAKFDPLELGRSNLDGLGTEKRRNPMDGFPEDSRIKTGLLHMDFTHGIKAGPDSDNFKAWHERLETISKKHGANGADDVWCAPTAEIMAYVSSSRSVKIEAGQTSIRLSLGKGATRSRLTIVAEGLPEDAKLPPTHGGLIFRNGDKAWITTPPIGDFNPLPEPGIELVHESDFTASLKFQSPVKVAGIRILQSGEIKKESPPKISFIMEDGSRKPFDSAKIDRWMEPAGSKWGYWRLYPLLPDEDAVTCVGIEISPEPAFKKMEVWALR